MPVSKNDHLPGGRHLSSFALPDCHAVSRLIENIAAEEIKTRFGTLSKQDIRTKTGPNDLVTIADEATEARLTPALMETLPGSVVVGEEAVAADETILKRLHENAPVWIIDPVDGTSNFASAKPIVAVIIALVFQGETQAAWIHDPIQGGMATAQKNKGAFWNGQKMVIQSQDMLSHMAGSLNLYFFPKDKREHIKSVMSQLGDISSLHCAGQEYLRLIWNKKAFALYHRIKPWDHAAGVLLHAEAGGYSAKLDGSSYKSTDDVGGLLLAPDQKIWHELHDLFFGEHVALCS